MSLLLDHLEKLNGFKTVADMRSFHKAAERLHISQPSLSSSIRILEDALGKTLLNRSHKGVSLTPEGAILLEFTNKLLTDVKSLTGRLESPEGELAGNLTIGLYESIAIYFWPRFFKEFRKSYPHIDLSLSTGRSQVLLEKLKKQELDLIVTVEPPPARQMISRPLHTDIYRFYASREIEDQLKEANRDGERGGFIKVPEGIPFLVFSSAISHNGDSLEESLIRHGFLQAKFYEVESFEAAKEIAANGIGIGVLPTRVAEVHVKSKKLRPVALRGFDREGFGEHRIAVTTRKESQSSRLVSCVVESLNQFLK